MLPSKTRCYPCVISPVDGNLVYSNPFHFSERLYPISSHAYVFNILRSISCQMFLAAQTTGLPRVFLICKGGFWDVCDILEGDLPALLFIFGQR